MAKIYDKQYDKQTEAELDVILQMPKEDIPQYCAMAQMKVDEEDIPAVTEYAKHNRKSGRLSGRAYRRKCAGYSVGHNKRTEEHITEKREALYLAKMKKNGLVLVKDRGEEDEGLWKEQERFDHIPFADKFNTLGYNKTGTITDLKIEQIEKILRKEADQDLTKEQMEFCGEMYQDSIYHRDSNEAWYRDYEETSFHLSCQESNLLDKIEETTAKLVSLKRSLAKIRKDAQSANRGMEYHKKLYEYYKDLVINEVLGIED